MSLLFGGPDAQLAGHRHRDPRSPSSKALDRMQQPAWDEDQQTGSRSQRREIVVDRYIGTGVASVINLLNIEKIVLGGGVIALLEPPAARVGWETMTHSSDDLSALEESLQDPAPSADESNFRRKYTAPH